MELNELITRGRVRRITRWGEPVLHAPCRPVTAFDDELHTLVADMWATMTAADGVGLAATQVGVDLAVFVFECPDEDGSLARGVFCNPVVSQPADVTRQLEESDEGCLSLPGAYADLARPDAATCTGQDHEGNPVSVTGTGLLARCLQHETDHLGGIVFGDRLTKKARRSLYRDHEALADHYPADWPVTPMVPLD